MRKARARRSSRRDSCGTVRHPNLASLERIHLLSPPPSFLAVVLPPEPKQTQDQEGSEGTKAVRHDEIHRRTQPCAATCPAPTRVRRRFWGAPRRTTPRMDPFADGGLSRRACALDAVSWLASGNTTMTGRPSLRAKRTVDHVPDRNYSIS